MHLDSSFFVMFEVFPTASHLIIIGRRPRDFYIFSAKLIWTHANNFSSQFWVVGCVLQHQKIFAINRNNISIWKQIGVRERERECVHFCGKNWNVCGTRMRGDSKSQQDNKHPSETGLYFVPKWMIEIERKKRNDVIYSQTPAPFCHNRLLSQLLLNILQN